MGDLAKIKIKVERCTPETKFRFWAAGGGWHYVGFFSNLKSKITYTNKDIFFNNRFSRLSKDARVLRKELKHTYTLEIESGNANEAKAVLHLLAAERVEAWLTGQWVRIYFTKNQSYKFEDLGRSYSANEVTFEVKAFAFTDRRLYLNGGLVELNDAEPIPLTKQTNDIAELKDRNSDFTPDFKIERTRHNNLLFKQAGITGADSELPYKRNAIKYVEDGVELIPNGYMVLLDTSEDFFHVALYSGNADLFKSLEGLKLNALNLSDLNHLFNHGVWSLALQDLKWLVFEPSKEGNALATEKLRLKNFRPFVSVKRLLQQIITAQGWTVDGDLSFINSWLLCPNLEPVLSQYDATAKLTKTVSEASNVVTFKTSNSVVLGDQWGLILGYNPNTLNRWIKLTRFGKYRFTVTGRFKTHNATRMVVRILFCNYMYGQDRPYAPLTAEIGANTTNDVEQNFSIVYELDAAAANTGYNIIFAAETEGTGATVEYYDFSVKLALVSSEIAMDDPLNVSSLLPDLEQSKFFKSVANMYGLILQPDAINKRLKFWRFSDLYNNRPFARDWSAYLHEDDATLTYKVGSYAAKNVLKYKESDEVPIGTGDGAFYILNETLETAKELFTLDFKASLDIYYKSKIVALIPVCEKDPETNTYKNLSQTGEARVVLAKAVTGEAVKYAGEAPNTTILLENYSAACFSNETTGESLTFSAGLIPNHYTGLVQVLQGAKSWSPRMFLPRTEVKNLDHSVPIYLAQTAKYYYVNKVNGYKRESLTPVELIEL